jgi:hypothetical protein
LVHNGGDCPGKQRFVKAAPFFCFYPPTLSIVPRFTSSSAMTLAASAGFIAPILRNASAGREHYKTPAMDGIVLHREVAAGKV